MAGRTGRRTFFARAFWGLAAAIGALLGIPVAAAFLSPGLRFRSPLRQPQASLAARLLSLGLRREEEESQWVAVGPVTSFGPEPRLAHHIHPAHEGWVNVTAEMQVWVVHKPGDGYKIFDNHCTHLGCPYHWDSTEQRFICPCHNGVFDINGNVISGPPPRPLDYYDAKVEAGTLYMGAFHRGGT